MWSLTAAVTSPTTSSPLWRSWRRIPSCGWPTPNLKSISYLSSQLPLLRDAKWDTDKQYKTASNVKSQQAGDHMSQALGTVAFTLPHSAELEGQYLAGNLLADLSMKDSRVFRKEIEKIAREVFGC